MFAVSVFQEMLQIHDIAFFVMQNWQFTGVLAVRRKTVSRLPYKKKIDFYVEAKIESPYYGVS
jgi:hypothetical protein